jgi:GGDEF domain-containing protein
MNLRQITTWGKQASPPPGGQPVAGIERSLTQLVEGTASNMLAIDPGGFLDFRGKVSQLAAQLRDGLPDAEKLALILSVLHEFEQYRKLSEEEMRDRVSGWRTLVSKLLVDLLARTGIDAGSSDAAPLVQNVASLLTGEELNGFLIQLTDFFRLSSADSRSVRAAQLTAADRTTANDNAAGLRGGGAALEHVRRIMEQGIGGYAVLFQLNCLGMIGERFGVEAVQDSLMAVSAFLTHSLRSDDAVYHWSDSTLLAILQTPVSENILGAAMRRIVGNNRDITIQIGGRTVMLRIPLEFEITPIDQLRTAEDLHKLSAPSAKKW